MWPSTWTSQPPTSSPQGMCGLQPMAPSGPRTNPFAGQQAPHELPFLVQPTQHGSPLHPTIGQRHPPMPVPPQQPHQQASPFASCTHETGQLCRTAPLPQQGPPMFYPSTYPQQHVPPLQAPGTFPTQELPVQSMPMPIQQNFVVPKPLETTSLSTPHHEPQAPTTEAPGIDLKALEHRLDAALEKKFENMATPLKQPLTSPRSGTPASVVGGTPATSGPTVPQPGDTPSSTPVAAVPVKAKPPTPPDHVQPLPSGDQPSQNSWRSPLPRDQKSSRRSRSRRRSSHRRRDPSPGSHRHERERRTTMTRSTHDQHSSRPEKSTTTSRTSRTEPTDGRRRDHPIYRRANTFRQVHQDAHSTVYTKETKDRTHSSYGSNYHKPRKDSNITLKSRSKSRPSTRAHGTLAIFERPQGVLLTAKARPERPKSPESTAPRETSASEFTEQVEIPTTTDLEAADWRRPSQERDDDETEQDEAIPIPKSVQKAFADTTRTKAPCEIPVREAITLPLTISKREFKAFQEELRTRNPNTPSNDCH